MRYCDFITSRIVTFNDSSGRSPHWGFGPFRYLVASPRFHRWHHTSEQEGLDRNFAGPFPWIDVVFGTFYMPEGREPQALGVAEAVPSGLRGQVEWRCRSTLFVTSEGSTSNSG